MWIHRTTPTANFTPFRNELLADPRISLGAHGLLTHLLSLRNGTQVDIKSLACHFKDTQQRIAGYYHELTEVGYVLRRKIKDLVTRKITTVIEVFDTPQLEDIVDLAVVVSDQVTVSLSSVSLPDPSPYPSGKTRDKEPPRTPRRRRQEPLPFAELGGEESVAPEHAASAALLARVGHVEPRLALGVLERASLLPLVTEWTARGASDRMVVERLTQALPREEIVSRVAFLKFRLVDRMPDPMPEATISMSPAQQLCDSCHRPTAGACLNCESQDRSSTALKPEPADDVALAGAARCREKLKARKRELSPV